MKTAVPIVLIGGIPAIGKSSLANKLSQKFGYYVISTDTVRRVMQVTTNKKDFPVLHKLFFSDADKYFSSISTKAFILDFIAESKEVFHGIIGVLNNNKAVQNRPLIIEGSMLTPEIVKQIGSLKKIVSFFIVAKTKKEVAQNINKRGLWAQTKHTKNLEKKFIWSLNKYLSTNATKNDFTIINAIPYATLLQRVIKELKKIGYAK